MSRDTGSSRYIYSTIMYYLKNENIGATSIDKIDEVWLSDEIPTFLSRSRKFRPEAELRFPLILIQNLRGQIIK